MEMLDDLKLYRQHALMNFLRKDKVASEYIKNNGEINEDMLQKFYRVHQVLQSKIIMIKLGKGMVKQSFMFAKSKFEQKLSFLKFITPENISIDVNEEEYLALINQVKEQAGGSSNLYFIIAKNIIVGLMNIDLEHFSKSLNGEEISSEQLRLLTKSLFNEEKTISSSPPLSPPAIIVTPVPSPSPFEETLAGKRARNEDSIDSSSDEEEAPILKRTRMEEPPVTLATIVEEDENVTSGGDEADDEADDESEEVYSIIEEKSDNSTEQDTATPSVDPQQVSYENVLSKPLYSNILPIVNPPQNVAESAQIQELIMQLGESYDDDDDDDDDDDNDNDNKDDKEEEVVAKINTEDDGQLAVQQLLNMVSRNKQKTTSAKVTDPKKTTFDFE